MKAEQVIHTHIISVLHIGVFKMYIIHIHDFFVQYTAQPHIVLCFMTAFTPIYKFNDYLHRKAYACNCRC